MGAGTVGNFYSNCSWADAQTRTDLSILASGKAILQQNCEIKQLESYVSIASSVEAVFLEKYLDNEIFLAGSF